MLKLFSMLSKLKIQFIIKSYYCGINYDEFRPFFFTNDLVSPPRCQKKFMEEMQKDTSLQRLNDQQKKSVYFPDVIYETEDDLEKKVFDCLNNVEYDLSTYAELITINAFFIRPKRRRQLINLLVKLVSKFGFRANNVFFNKEQRDLLIQNGIIKRCRRDNDMTPLDKLYNFFPAGSVSSCIMQDNIEEFRNRCNDIKFDMFKKMRIGEKSELFSEKDKGILNYINIAAFSGSSRVFKFLMVNRLEIITNAARLSIVGGNKEIVDILMQNGEDFDDCLNDAVKYYRNDLIGVLLDHYVNAVPSLYHCLQSYNLIAFTFFEPYQGIKGNCIFTLLAEQCCEPMLRISYEMSKDIKYGDLNEALLISANCGNIGCVKFLLECKTNVEGKASDGNTPLHNAAKQGYLDIVKLLIEEHGADANAENSINNTPLHLAVMNERMDVIKYLVETVKVNMTIKNKRGFTPYDIAMDASNDEVSHFFRTIKKV